MWPARGVLFGAVVVIYREPRDSKLVNQAELDYTGGRRTAKTGSRRRPCRGQTFFGRAAAAILIISLAQFCGNTVLVFLLDFVNTCSTSGT